jgi:glucosamine-6-phosphate deaminase
MMITKTPEMDLTDSFERIPVSIHQTAREGATSVAATIAELIRQKQRAKEPCVLGLATGSTPKSLYAELVRMHRTEALSFKNVITFNLDEYYPMAPDALSSYHRFMHEQLFDFIDIDPQNVHIPDGTVSKDEVKAWCESYENEIKKAGGIDLQVLGIGTNGHIGFNEPGSGINSRTRIVALDNMTRLANSYDFPNMAEVPRLALTMGISTIMKSRKVVLMAWGQHKAPVIRKAVEGHSIEQVPASLLQQHDDCLFVLDEQAAQELTRFKSPWLTGEIDWSPRMIRKAVCTMALDLGKPILMLTDNDYHDHGLSDLLVQFGASYDINLMVFNGMRNTITGWPGGKPGVEIPGHPERSEPKRKRVLIFSPHPDDDIISMGGTFIRLHDQGHDVHVGYQTSGNIAVSDEFVTRFIDFVVGFDEIFGIDKSHATQLMQEAREFLKSKKPSDIDAPDIREIKGLIRRCEAKATCRYVGIPEDHVHFMNLPFYETGKIEKNAPGEEDVRITMELIADIKPHQIYAAGDLADPHGTHKVCLDVIFEALARLRDEPYMKDCWMWLYRGAWQEFDIYDIEMAVPMSPDQVLQKRHGVFIHQSQKDSVPFQGSDTREFWQRAEERNATTAEVYDQLGLPKYAALEAFARHYY